MKRTLPWALFALVPLVLLLIAVSFDSPITQYFADRASVSDLSAFLAKYWWACMFGFIALHFAYFVASALRNRALSPMARVLWSVAFLALGPGIVPVYWWITSTPGNNRGA